MSVPTPLAPRGRLSRTLSVLGTLAILVGAGFGLQAWLKSLGGERPRVELSPPGAVLSQSAVFIARGQSRKGRFLLDGAAPPSELLLDARTLQLAPGKLSPGLHTVDWRQTFVGQRERGVTFGLMTGPFRDPSAPTPCAIKVSLRQAALDTFGPRLSAMVRQKAESVPGLPAIVRSEAMLSLVEGGVDAKAKVAFVDGSELQAIVPLSLSTKIDAPIQLSLRGDVQVEVSGAVGAMASLKGGGLLAALAEVVQRPEGGIEGALSAARRAGNEAVRSEVQGALEGWLSTFNQELRTLVPPSLETSLLEVKARLTLSPCGTPRVRAGSSLTLRYGARFEIAAPGASPPPGASQLPGPPRRENGELDARPLAGKAGLTLLLSPAALDAFLDAAWRSGTLSLLGANPEVVRRTNARLAGRVSFRLLSVKLGLPPVLELSEDGALLRAAEATLHLEEQEAGAVDLVLTGDARLGAVARARSLLLSAQALGVRGSCRGDRSTAETSEVREPCYPELLSALSEVLATQGALSHEQPSALGLSEARVWVSEVELSTAGLAVGLQLAPNP